MVLSSPWSFPNPGSPFSAARLAQALSRGAMLQLCVLCACPAECLSAGPVEDSSPALSWVEGGGVQGFLDSSPWDCCQPRSPPRAGVTFRLHRAGPHLFLSGGQDAPWVQPVSSEFFQNSYHLEVSLPETS